MKKLPDDDLFKDSVMTFGEHLEDLRRCLWKAVLGLFIGFLIGLYFADWVVNFIQSPLQKALEGFYLNESRDELLRINPTATPEEIALIEERQMIFNRVYVEPHAVFESLHRGDPEKYPGRFPVEVVERRDLPNAKSLAQMLVDGKAAAERVWSQLKESEQKTVRTVAAADEVSPADLDAIVAAFNRLLDEPDLLTPEIVESLGVGSEWQAQFERRAELNADERRQLNWQLLRAALPGQLAAPHTLLQEVLLWKPVASEPRTKAQSLGTAEPFMIWLKAAFLAGLVVSSPWVFYQIWSFVAAGLYPHEKKYVHVFMPFSIGLFLVGAAIAFFFVFEPVLAFFLSYNRSLKIDPGPQISQWLNFVLFLPVGFGIAFQLPLVMLFLERINVMNVTAYWKQWRVAILVIWILAAVLTPADPTSIFFLAVPLMVLYFGGILLCKWWPNKK